MLTNLDFLKTGQPWPPTSEARRLETYKDNRLLFEGKGAEVYKAQFKRITRVIGNFSDVVSYAVLFNYHKLLSVKIADLVFGEPPGITIADKLVDGKKQSDARQQVIDDMLIDTGLLQAAYSTALDVSRYGDGIMLMALDNGQPTISPTPPALWFPVVDQRNIKRFTHHVFAWVYEVDLKTKDHRLYVQVHKVDEPGKCEEHTYQLTNGGSSNYKIGGEVRPDTEDTSQIITGLDACPVFIVPNLITSDRIYGMDDYADLDSIISELDVRVSQISKILDVHANPSMSGPMSALEQDPVTGEWRLRVGDYYPRNTKDDPVPEYIVWDAALEANFKQIELLVNQLYTISEMGSAIFGDLTSKTGQVPSGSALRRLLMSPLAKARRIANSFDIPIKQLVVAAAKVLGAELKPSELSITWQDGLPDDPAEEVTIMSTRTAGKQTLSQYTALRRLDKMSDEDAESEMQQIADEAAAAAPEMLTTTDINADTEPEESDE